MTFYTAVLRKSSGYWVALCLENGIVGQGATKDEVLQNLKDAIYSFEEVRTTEEDVFCQPISINELHEFLTVEGPEPFFQPYELRAVSA